MDLKDLFQRPARIGRYLLAIFLTGLFAAVWVTRAPAVVDLSDFSATARETDILVEWVTATELNNAGFFVHRSLSENGEYTVVSDLIEPTGDQFVGDEYEWPDTNVDVGVEYWYKLEAIDLQSGSEFYGPVSAIIGSPNPTSTTEPTATLTPTNTNTGTAHTTTTPATATRTSRPATQTSTATITRTSTARPTNTPPPAIPTITWTSTPSLAAATATRPAGSPTVTFIPIPSITFVVSLGDTGQEITAPSAEEQQVADLQSREEDQPRGSWFTPQRIIVIAAIGLVWALLGGWFFLSMRQLDV